MSLKSTQINVICKLKTLKCKNSLKDKLLRGKDRTQSTTQLSRVKIVNLTMRAATIFRTCSRINLKIKKVFNSWCD